MTRGGHPLTSSLAGGDAPQIDDLGHDELFELQEMATSANLGIGAGDDDLGFAREFEPEKWANDEGWDAFVDKTLGLLQQQGLLVRPQQRKSYLFALRVILANLMAACSQNERLYLRYSRREEDSGGFPFKPKIKLIDALLEAGLVTGKKGFLDRVTKRAKQSRMRATGLLVALAHEEGASPEAIVTNCPPVLIKDTQDRYHAPKPTSRARDMSLKVRRINDALSQQNVGLELPMGTPWPSFKDRTPLDTTRRLICREFKDHQLKLGGRFYKHWVQSLKSDLRPYITLNGEPTVELDFGCCQPSMLYAKVGLPACPDAYDVPGIDRDLAKIAFNVLLFHDDPATAPQAVLRSARREGFHVFEYKDAMDLLAQLRAKHGPIDSYFFKGHSLALQYEDSCIAEDIMFSLIRNGIPFIPVHDSFIVPARYESALGFHMNEAYSKRIGQCPIIKRKAAPVAGAAS